MPRKSTRTASGSSPDKPAARRTRRGQKSTEEVDTEVIDEIPPHLLKPSDESSEQSDNDSDYGSPKKGRGRGRGRGRKPKEPVVEEKEKQTPARPRRGRRAAAQSPIQEEQHSQDYQESANSQTTNDEQDASTMDSTTLEKEKSPEPETVESNAETIKQEEPQTTVIADEPIPEVKEIEVVKVQETKENEPEKVQPEHIEEKEVEPIEPKSPPKDIEHPEQPKKQEAPEESEEIVKQKEPVNEEVKADNQDESNVENKDMSSRDDEVVSAEIDDKHESLVDDEVSKEAPELPIQDQSDSRSRSRSNSSETEIEQAKVALKRSRSSSGEIHDESVDKMDVDDSIEIENKKKESPVKTATKIDRKSPPKTTGDEKPVQRKRKWGARKTDDEPVIAITTDSLKNVITEEVQPVDVKLASSPSPEPEEKRQRVKLTSEDRDVKKKLLKERLRKQEEEEDRRNEQIAKAIERSQTSPTIIVTNGAGKDRKVSVVNNEEPSEPPTPSKNQTSRIICITNLVRPLTFMAVKALVARTGEIEDFWIDAIKSKCFVVYKTEDEAVETRHALHGVKWPEHNLKTLNVEFSTEDEMNKIIEATRGERITNESAASRETKPEKSFGWSKQESQPEDRSKNSRRVREWDVGKKEETERDEDRENRRRKRSSEQRDKVVKRRSVSKSPVREEQKDMTPVPQQRLLDDLFRKTKALPFIYWMPLSEERIKELEEQRLKNIAEHNRRMEEMVKMQKERREAREMRMREEDRKNKDRRRSRSPRDNRRRSVDRSRDRNDRNRRYDRR
ncbi:hypothetical protein ACKWTF_001092 [Chironomus riparius]